MDDLAVDAIAGNSGPVQSVPMSFPAILRTPGLSDRFAHLRPTAEKAASAPAVPRKNRRDDKEGKRWVRRKENARFVGNVHIVLPSNRDFSIVPPSAISTFPHPLPHYLSRNNTVPAAVPPAREPNSANAGRFSLSLKGMRRELRKHGPRTELIVRDVESELVAWLLDAGVLLEPDTVAEMALPGVPVGGSDAIREVSRTPLQLVWWIEDDAFTRYVVHCCARYHDIVSFSKDISGQRLTYLLRPNITRQNFHASAALDTPPGTDRESSVHEFDSESDFVSDRDARSDAAPDSDAEGPRAPDSNAEGPRAPALAAIAERSAPASPAPANTYVSRAPASDDEWSIVGGDTDADADDSEAEQLVSRVGALALEHTPRAEPRVRQVSLRAHLWERGRRAASSPSRSPARRLPRRVEPPRAEQHAAKSFYDYLYA